MEPFSFEKLPEVIRILFEKVEHMEELLQDLQPQSPNENELLTIHEAAEFLKVTVPALYTKVSRQEIPVSKPGKRLYFNKTELRKWIIASRKKTVMEIRKEAEEHMKMLNKHKNFI
ncbi:helix-turn-helix domain-containing protein [Pedobacter gandavensis]|uniref:Helix-turn-helix domain-containing protein n=1 Tax=Pedobacter gandavensis TaxID=2679963 RepID=A0ABR6EPZ7_9SPHI|nr:helix-turn-helix domain-containing protein [Pedobacter gandavensis]MBB2147321.1 helix-turn-helix domain-containing protein [Pedobacter gandavensis]